MSEDRQTLPSGAVDQTTRSGQAEPHDEPQIQSEEDVVEASRRRIAELEDADRKREEQLAAERRRAAEAETRAAEADRRAREAETRAVHATNTGQQTADHAKLGEITTALTARKEQMTSLEAQLEAAFTAGEGAKLAKIQSQMATVGAQVVQLEGAKTLLDQRIEQAKTQAANPPQQTVEQYRQDFVRQQPARVQEWLRHNWERYWGDQDFQDRAAAAALAAQRLERLPIDSQEYIDYVNEKMGLTQPRHHQEDPPSRGGDNGRGRTPDAGAGSDSGRRMVAAPAGGSVPGTSSGTRGGSDGIYLTKGDKEHARALGVPEAEYAKHKQDLLNEGLIGPGARNR